MNEVWYPRNTQRELYVKTGSLLESSKCGRRGGSNVKATTDKFDSMRTFSEEVVKFPLLLFTESHEYSSSTCSSVFLVLAYFPSLGGINCHIWTTSIRGCVNQQSMLLLPLSPYYKSRDSMKFGGYSSNTISDTCG